MKKLLLVNAILFAFLIGKSQTSVTVVNAGFTFNNDTVSIAVGDTVKWLLQSSHNAMEVSQANWSAGSTISNGGFTTPFGGGFVKFTNPGTYYYMCANHGGGGMKGVVIVSGVSVEEENFSASITTYPTKVESVVNVKINSASSQQVKIVVFNVLGVAVKSIPVTTVSGEQIISFDCTEFASGPYFVRVQVGETVKTMRIMKQ